MNSAAITKWLELVRFEFFFQLRRPSSWFFFFLFMFPLIGVTTDVFVDVNREVLFHAPIVMAENAAIMGLVAMLVSCAGYNLTLVAPQADEAKEGRRRRC